MRKKAQSSREAHSLCLAVKLSMKSDDLSSPSSESQLQPPFFKSVDAFHLGSGSRLSKAQVRMRQELGRAHGRPPANHKHVSTSLIG